MLIPSFCASGFHSFVNVPQICEISGAILLALVGLTAGWLVGRLAGLAGWLVWLVGWLAGWQLIKNLTSVFALSKRSD